MKRNAPLVPGAALEKARRRVSHPDGALFLSAATRREGRYRCGQLKPFRLLHTEAAIACPHQVGQTTWTRQLITSSFAVRLWAYRRRVPDPQSASHPLFGGGGGPGH